MKNEWLTLTLNLTVTLSPKRHFESQNAFKLVRTRILGPTSSKLSIFGTHKDMNTRIHAYTHTPTGSFVVSMKRDSNVCCP